MEIETRSNTCLYPILVLILYTCFMIVSVLILDQEFVRLIVVDFFLAKTYIYLVCDKNLN